MNKDWLLTLGDIESELTRLQPEGFDWGNLSSSELVKFKIIAQAQIDKLIRLGWKSKEEIAEFGLSVNEAAIQVGRQQERERIFKQVKKLLNGVTHAPHKEGTCQICDSDFWQALKEAK